MQFSTILAGLTLALTATAIPSLQIMIFEDPVHGAIEGNQASVPIMKASGKCW